MSSLGTNKTPKKTQKKHDAGPKPLATESGTGDRHFWESPEGITNSTWSKKGGDFSGNQHGDSPILTTKHGDVFGDVFLRIYKLIIGIQPAFLDPGYGLWVKMSQDPQDRNVWSILSSDPISRCPRHPRRPRRPSRPLRSSRIQDWWKPQIPDGILKADSS